jgi:hypothetical protein
LAEVNRGEWDHVVKGDDGLSNRASTEKYDYKLYSSRNAGGEESEEGKETTAAGLAFNQEMFDQLFTKNPWSYGSDAYNHLFYRDGEITDELMRDWEVKL